MGKPARVLMLTSSFPRWQGDATAPFILDLAQDLQSLGWLVDVVAPHAPGLAIRDNLDGVGVERFRYLWPERLQTVCYGGGALIQLRRNHSNLLKLPAFIASEWASLTWRLLRRRYDLLHTHWILPQGLVGAVATGLAGTPHVVTVHGSDVFALQGSALQRLKRIALHRADAVTVNSSATDGAVRDIAGDLPMVRRIPMGIDAKIAAHPRMVAEIRRQYRRHKGPFLVFVGRVVREKGVGDLISAAALLRDREPNLTLAIIGSGSEQSVFEQQAERLGVRDCVFFVGAVPSNHVPSYLAAADMFVGPSHFEAQGLVFAEAMSVGTPVVATRVGGIADTVRDGETGVTVRPGAPDEIAGAVSCLLGDPTMAQRMAGAARTFVEHKFSRSVSANAFSELFQSVLDKRHMEAEEFNRSLNEHRP